KSQLPQCGSETVPNIGHPAASVAYHFPGVEEQRSLPHCGTTNPTETDAPCGKETELAPNILGALVSAWTQAADGHQATAEALATAFRLSLEAQPELVALSLRSDWIEAHYPILCAAFGVRWPPPFKDFAKELGEQMDRKRVDVRRKGMKRET